MHIGYISYEHPLGVAGGGIGTYLDQVASLMTKAGHQVEVFTCHPELNESLDGNGYRVHRVQASSINRFRENVLEAFAERHLTAPFDLIESAEYGADALCIKKKFPSLPFVVKLHTPSYHTQALNDKKTSLKEKARFLLGGLVRGTVPKPYWIYRKEEDPEYQQYLLADGLCSPSASLAHLVKEKWPLNMEVAVIPNPFVPNPEFLNIPVASYSGGEFVVSFFGRLEKRKGVLELMKAIPLILEKDKRIVFQFIGKAHPSPVKGMDMAAYLQRELGAWQQNLRFLGYQPYDRMPDLLKGTHVCIFPSLWENFPNVCLEAMVAGRAVIASVNGGMAEMIRHQEEGLLVSPTDTQKMADAVLSLAENAQLVSAYGAAARKRVLDAYNASCIGQLVTDFYHATIEQKVSVTI